MLVSQINCSSLNVRMLPIIVLSLWCSCCLISGLKENITRMADGDLLSFGNRNIDCGILKAKCTIIGKLCNICKCVPPRSTFVRAQNRCMGANEMTKFGYTSDRFQLINTAVLSMYNRKVRSKAIRAKECQLTTPNSEFYSDKGTWRIMSNVSLSLTRRGKRKIWDAKFDRAAILKMLSNHGGRIARANIRCTMRSKQLSRFCILFKIAGMLKLNDEVDTLIILYTSVLPSITSILPTTVSSTSLVTTGSGNIHEHTKQGQTMSSKLIWIITIVFVIVILILSVVIFVLYRRHRKAAQAASSAAQFQSFNLPTTSKLEPEEHIYASVSEIPAESPIYTSPCTGYEELQPRMKEPDTSDYKSLEPQEVQYVIP